MDDADPVDPGQFEFEAGVAVAHDSYCDSWELPLGLTAGIFSNVEAGVSFGGLFEERNEATGKDRECGIGDLEFAAKWKFFPGTKWIPRQALAVAVKLPTAEDGKGLGSGRTDYDITWVASVDLSEVVTVHLNAGYTWIGEPSGEDVGDVAHYGTAVEFQLTDVVQWVGEMFAEKELQGDTQTVVSCNIGFRWNPTENLTLDIAAGTGLHGNDTPDISFTTGLTLCF
jgi:hypothetical protein